MSDAIVSKNHYELLGNDPELDPDRATPPVPTKVIDKPAPRIGKRNGPAEGATRDGARQTGGGRGGAVRGDGAGSNSRADQQNDRHSRPARDSERRGGEGRGRGDRRGRGGFGGRGRGGAPRDDRHSHTGIGGQEKQAAHGWGGNDGEAEWADESAGDAIAKAEASNEPGFTPDAVAADPASTNGPDGELGEDAVAEAEDKTKSYDDYLKELAEKKLALSGEAPSIRKANEGTKQAFPEGQAFSREQEDFFIGGGGKTKKTKEIKEKERVNLDGQYYAAPDAGDRGGRGGRGGRGRGGDRGSSRGEGRGRGGRGRGDRSDRGDRGDRGDFRGAPRGDRAPRGGFNPNDSSAFPALGA